MGRTGVLQEIRVMRFEEIYDRFYRCRLSSSEAAEWLGVSERTFRRWRQRYEDEGLDGLVDRRLGKASPHRVPVDETERVLELYRTRYRDWPVAHFHDHLVERHGISRSYGWTKSVLHASGLVRPARRRSAHRKKRPRRPYEGMMLHQDGSRHEWLGGEPALDLIVTLDDATSTTYSAFFCAEEGTDSSFRGLMEVSRAHGLPCSLYTDRGSHYFHTPQAGGKVDRERLTQVGRALAQLGIEHIAAYSPEARGRSERMFGTLQGRLVRELADAGITGIDEANRYLREVYLPAHNKRFAVAAAEAETAFVPLADPAGLADILCHQEERVVGNDNTVRFAGFVLQIPESPGRAHFVKARVRVHRYPDGTKAIFHGPRRIARYNAEGKLIEETMPKAA